MTVKQLDRVIIGHDLSALMLSIVAMLRGEKSLLVEHCSDQLIAPTYSLNSFESEYLRCLGEQWGIAPLCHIDIYLTKVSREVQLGEISILLNGTPFENLKELLRKWILLSDQESVARLDFSPFLDNEYESSFNEQFEMFVLRTSSAITKSKNLDAIIDSLFLEELKNITTPVVQSISHPLVKQFFQLISIWSHSLIEEDISKQRALLLFVELISPHYLLDHERLLADLKLLFDKLGGKLRRGKIIDWDWHNQEKLNIQLNTFDGIFQVKQVNIFDSDLQFEQNYLVERPNHLYNKIEARFSLMKHIPELHYHLINGVWQQGNNNVTFWQLFFAHDHITITFLQENISGTHSDKIRFMLKQFLQQIFAPRFFDLPLSSLRSITFVDDVVMENVGHKLSTTLFTTQGKSQHKKVIYHGDLIGRKYGILSKLYSLQNLVAQEFYF